MMIPKPFAGNIITRVIIPITYMVYYRDTLTADLLIDYIKEKNILVWAGNVHESEAHKGIDIYI
jgi:hypothetical protein